eukprot:g28064.t1
MASTRSHASHCRFVGTCDSHEKAGLELELVTRSEDHLVFGSHKAAPMDLRTFFEEHPKECEKLAGECHKAYRPEHLGFVQLTGF